MKLTWPSGQPFWLGLRIRFNRLRSGKWNERCEACGKRMSLDGTGISDRIGSMDLRYHARCYQLAAYRNAFAASTGKESDEA